jgi:PHD/YefM family antitoxin component YafN of YafNO toxin-antitoxin module
MTMTCISSRELNQNITKAKRDAQKGPVFITSRNKTTHVLLTVEDYRKMIGDRKSILDALQPPEGVSFDLETERVDIQLRKAEF